MTNDCGKCKSIYQKLEQHEQTITQLLAIIAVTNKKLIELNFRQNSYELMHFPNQRSTSTNFALEVTSQTSNTPKHDE
ncbi:hypothetical protein GH741_04750 [Aquibacillus halophilus]|uniref:Uncharacterized protein n=1 Tax=Aquibacillus halophilus TaxID=930132 RepID=A0A6A8D897_9BACI|nr:hypothetical protein [Aquibacillus halophilus]MRH41983.1 hypothetical protein [Aquibacillus halophilus]